MTESKKVKEEVLSYEEGLEKKITELESTSKRMEYEFHQVQGAISFAKATLEDYRNSLKEQVETVEVVKDEE